MTYDEIGNLTGDGTWTYTWTHGRQLASMSKLDGSVSISYEYNAAGLRTKKTVNGVETKYTLSGKQVVHMTRGNDWIHFYYDAQGKPSIVNYNGTMYHYLYNLQGDVIGLVDDSGNIAVEYSYDAWGKSLATTGSLNSTLGYLNPFRYRGYVYDEETGMHYLRNRYFTTSIHRFISSDILINNDSLLGSNQYVYCCNNPICCSDTEGTFACMLFGGLCGLAIKGIQSICSGKSTKETIAAAVGGAVTGAINGIAMDISFSPMGLTLAASTLNIASILISGLANVAGDAVEYFINNSGSLEGYSITRAINQFITGAISGAIITYTSAALKKILDDALKHCFDVSQILLEKYNIIDYSFMDDIFKLYGGYIYSLFGYNALTQLLDPIEVIPSTSNNSVNQSSMRGGVVNVQPTYVV